MYFTLTKKYEFVNQPLEQIDLIPIINQLKKNNEKLLIILKYGYNLTDTEI